MNRTWQLSDLEFFVLWDDLDEGVLPAPLEFLARTNDYDEFQRQRAEARARLRPVLGHAFEEFRDTLAYPDIRIEMFGRDAREPGNQEHFLRILGIRRGPTGYLVRQLPGETMWHSTGFVVTECNAPQLGRLLAEQLPDAEPGRHGVVALPTAESETMDHNYGRSVVHSGGRRSYGITEFLQATVGSTGMIAVHQNLSRFGPRGLTSQTLIWRDHIDDGRYAVTLTTAAPVDTKRLTTLIDTAIADVVRAIKDERL
jgi:hypothetical protein